MQDAEQVRNEIQELCSSLLEHNLVLGVFPPIIQRVPDAKIVISPPQREAAALISEDSFTTLSEYRRIIRHNLYTCLLADAGVLQLSYTFRGDSLVHHRLCYYPCPFQIDFSEFSQEDDLATIFELHIERAFQAERQHDVDAATIDPDALILRTRSAIRFDFDEAAAGENHPASHLHIAHESCRIAAYAPLSVGHFVRFVFRHFYPESWASHLFLRQWPLHHFNRCIGGNEQDELFIECHPGVVES